MLARRGRLDPARGYDGRVMTRLPNLGPRGEGYVAIQGVLLVVVVATMSLGPAWTGALREVAAAAGLVLVLAGAWLAVRGTRDLAENLTPFPQPNETNRLIDTGVYGLVRHPIYGGLILGAAGLGLLAASPTTLLAAVALELLFELKSRREEAWLIERHSDYAAYRTHTRRLIPWLH